MPLTKVLAFSPELQACRWLADTEDTEIASLWVANQDKDDQNEYCQDNAYRLSSSVLIGI